MPPESLIVELITDGQTDPEIFPFLCDRHKEAGLHPLVAQKESTGFVMNRIWAAIARETLGVLADDVSTPQEIDAAFKELYGARDGPCHLMDNVGLDTVAYIEEHYVAERHLSRTHLDWLEKNYIQTGRLGKKGDQGGLYPKPPKGSQTLLYFLNVGMGEPLQDAKSFTEVMHRGQILTLNVDEGGKATEIIGKEYNPDGM